MFDIIYIVIMVYLCTQPYPEDTQFNTHFDKFPFSLSDFQKYAIEAIVKEQHVLITAHTGSGKTLPAEFAIQHFHSLGKKVVYTSPIKALSNQKYYEFTQKYPHISFGLFTGDIKTNPEADVLIMTTEILMNYLFTATTTTSGTVFDSATSETNTLQFQIDIQTELGCVVFDEVHYINDADRGQTWEKTILMLPPHIQMVMLSATIDNPEGFAKWCEKGLIEQGGKQVYLASTNHRVVPLTHYGFLTNNEGVFKHIKDKETQQDIKQNTNKLMLLQDANGKFNENTHKKLTNMIKLYQENKVFINRRDMLNKLAKFLRERDMLPAIMFVFSRKMVELCAQEITVPILPEDSKLPYTIKKECDAILRKLPNHKEYMELPEYIQLVSLLEKGIGIHHSGMIPVLREIVELMISKKYIYLLFATESFAIGLDCPIKTVVFNNLTKFDGNHNRFLQAHEYTQMAGRAGRRGIDTIGYVVHCNNLFKMPTLDEYKTILGGKPQKLTSKFHISYSLILNLIKNGCTRDFHLFSQKSMIQNEISGILHQYRENIKQNEQEIENQNKIVNTLKTSKTLCDLYLDLQAQLPTLKNKKRKEAERELTSMDNQYKTVKKDTEQVKQLYALEDELNSLRNNLYYNEQYIRINTEKIVHILKDNGFINEIESDDGIGYSFTSKGKMAACIAEAHPLVLTELCVRLDYFESFTPKQIVGILSSFADVKVPDELKQVIPNCSDYHVTRAVDSINDMIGEYADLENENRIWTGYNYGDALQYDLMELSMMWCDKNNEYDCKVCIQDNVAEKEISIGDFNKALLKIVTMAKELSNVCEEMGQIELLHKLGQIEPMILKYVTTSQSLYL